MSNIQYQLYYITLDPDQDTYYLIEETRHGNKEELREIAAGTFEACQAAKRLMDVI